MVRAERHQRLHIRLHDGWFEDGIEEAVSDARSERQRHLVMSNADELIAEVQPRQEGNHVTLPGKTVTVVHGTRNV